MPSKYPSIHFIGFSLLTLFACLASADEGYFLPLPSGNYPGATDLAVGDFNGDMNDDFVMIFGIDDEVVFPVATPNFYLQTNAGIFNVVRNGNPVVGSRVAAADFNGDTFIDLVITGGDTANSLVFPSSTAVYFNSGDWSVNTGFDFDAPLVLGQLQYAPELVVGDYDGDGDEDIILGVSEPGGFGTVVIWINQGYAQAGTEGTFQSVNYIESAGPYSEITALSLGQVSITNSTLDLMFARENTNKFKIALNDNLGGFSTTTTDISVNGTAVNDIQMVVDQTTGNAGYLAIANSGSPSLVYHIPRNISGMPVSYDIFRELGTVKQQSEKIISLEFGTQEGFFLSSDFDGTINAGIPSLAYYGFDLLGSNHSLGVVPQCLLPSVEPALGAVSLTDEETGFKDLILLTQVGHLYQLFNNQNPALIQCCMTDNQFIAVTDPNSPTPIFDGTNLQYANGLSQAEIWLDSFIKLRDIREVLMPLSLDAQRYVNNYDQHETQLLQLMGSDAQIANAWSQVITSWNEPITELLNGNDDQYILTGMQMNDLSHFLTLLQNESGVGVTVSSELALIQPLMSYVGSSMQDFTDDTIAVSSPIIFKNGFE